MKRIFGIGVNAHDHNTYDGVLHKQFERYSRIKKNIPRHPKGGDVAPRQFFIEEFLPIVNDRHNSDTVIAFTWTDGTRKKLALEGSRDYLKTPCYSDVMTYDPQDLWDYIYKDNIYYIDHHQSHAIYAMSTSNFEECDILAIDGGGCRYFDMETHQLGHQICCLFFDKNGKVTDLTDTLPLGWFWNICCRFTQFKTSDSGKLMGLAAYGKYNETFYQVLETHLEAYKTIWKNEKKYNSIQGVDSFNFNPEDVAFTLQQFTLDKIREHIPQLKTSENLCIAGGVAYNGYMNECLTKYWKNVHVPPAPGDEGQAIGAYVHAQKILNNVNHIPNVYSGESYEVDETIFDEDLTWEVKSFDEIAKEIAKEIANGKIIGWFQGKSESGNRALGNRSILADPRNPDIKDIINSKIKLREDFRPFAPSVLHDHYKEYFDTNQPSPYMSRIMPVISDKIPGVTHIDGTARIQTVTRDFNQRYYDLINEFYKITDIPMLLNTSFNCREPIVETPSDAIKTFKKCGLDIVVINNHIVRKKK